MRLNLFKASERNQYFTVLVANFIAFSHGNITGWFSPALLVLGSPDTPLKDGPMTTEQLSWVASALFLGGYLGLALSGPILARYGNRISLMCMAIPHFFWWALIAFGDHYAYLIVARVLAGYTGVNLFKIIPSYVAEIAESGIRGKLGSLMPLFYNAGILLGFILGSYLPYKYIPLTVILSVMSMFAVFFYIPETPQFLLQKGEKEKAYASLLFYRTVDTNDKTPPAVEREFSELTEMQSLKSGHQTPWWFILSKDARYGFWMSVFLVSVTQCSGFMALIQFTAIIFEESGSSLEPNDAAIIVAAIQTLGVYVSIFLVDRFGRKVLFLTSCATAGISLGVLGGFSYLHQHGFEVAVYNWIPIVSFSAAIFLISIGITAVTITIITELLLPEIKNVGMTIVNVFGTTWGFAIHKFFPVLLEEIQIYGVVWIFAGSCFIGLIVCAILLPETKGRNLNKM